MKRAYLFYLPIIITLMAGCASSVVYVPAERPQYTLEDLDPNASPSALGVSDPMGPGNKEIYRFNYYFDKYLFLPVVNTYKFAMPDYAEKRVSSFFDNLGELTNFTNALLQFKPKSAGITLSRFAINSTVGIAGLWDMASYWDMTRQDEDFGQTLGHYGVKNGPYVILPVMGPSNARDIVGLVADTAVFEAIDPLNFDNNDGFETPFQITKAVDARSRQSFRYYKSGSPFEYELVRLLYSEKRKLQIAK